MFSLGHNVAPHTIPRVTSCFGAVLSIISILQLLPTLATSTTNKQLSTSTTSFSTAPAALGLTSTSTRAFYRRADPSDWACTSLPRRKLGCTAS
ncbi:hypothetical protein B0H34DRAFT_696538 [Crassisporium funariophilum]|nr:hypothetical protein B0H34DRAFT_696538 [Crassisporium funariophilum]